jgi:trimeric autotransporter adhesin
MQWLGLQLSDSVSTSSSSTSAQDPALQAAASALSCSSLTVKRDSPYGGDAPHAAAPPKWLHPTTTATAATVATNSTSAAITALQRVHSLSASSESASSVSTWLDNALLTLLSLQTPSSSSSSSSPTSTATAAATAADTAAAALTAALRAAAAWSVTADCVTEAEARHTLLLHTLCMLLRTAAAADAAAATDASAATAKLRVGPHWAKTLQKPPPLLHLVCAEEREAAGTVQNVLLQEGLMRLTQVRLLIISL